MTAPKALKIAAAQSISHPGDLVANVRNHLRFISAAQALGVQVLIFPELSLSGYELELLSDLAMNPDDVQLDAIRTQARVANMTVIVGAPFTLEKRKPAIATFTYFPDGIHSVYCKQHLHPGEERFASAGEIGSTVFRRHGETLAQAICADTMHTTHAQAAAARGASLYLAGVLLSVNGYEENASLLQHYARAYSMGVLMSNYAGVSGGYVSAGKSTFFASGGELIAAASGADEGLLVASKDSGQWRGGWHVV